MTVGTSGYLKKGTKVLGEEPDAACRCLKPGGLLEIVGGGLIGGVGAGAVMGLSRRLAAKAGSEVQLPSGDLVLVLKGRRAVIAEVRPLRQPRRLAEFEIGAENVELTEHRANIRARALTTDGALLAFDIPRGFGVNKFNATVAGLLIDGNPIPKAGEASEDK